MLDDEAIATIRGHAADFSAAIRADVPALLADREELRALARELAEALFNQRHPSGAPGLRFSDNADADDLLAKARDARLLP